MEQVKLTADLRTEYGKSAARKLRRAGFMPAVLYGQKTEPVALSLELYQLKKAMSTEARESILIDLTIAKGEKTQNRTVMLKELQVDPLKGNYLHADFYEVAMDERIVVPISIHLIGKAKGVEAGGVMRQVRREIEVSCLPSEIPEHIEIDISDLEIGNAIHLSEIKLNERVEILGDLNTTIATVLPPTVVKEEEPAEEFEEEGIEGEDAPKETQDEEKNEKGDVKST